MLQDTELLRRRVQLGREARAGQEAFEEERDKLPELEKQLADIERQAAVEASMDRAIENAIEALNKAKPELANCHRRFLKILHDVGDLVRDLENTQPPIFAASSEVARACSQRAHVDAGLQDKARGGDKAISSQAGLDSMSLWGKVWTTVCGGASMDLSAFPPLPETADQYLAGELQTLIARRIVALYSPRQPLNPFKK